MFSMILGKQNHAKHHIFSVFTTLVEALKENLQLSCVYQHAKH